MVSIKEYLNETTNFNRRVEIITEFLNNSGIQLKELINLLEKLFDALKRSNNLINFMKNYSQTFESQMIKLGDELTEIKEKVVSYQIQLSNIEQIIQETRTLTDSIEESAHTFIKFARMITYLAENIEVKAYQARQEGVGLAVIARETYKIAKSSELLFQHFDELLEVIRKNVEPFSAEIDMTIKDATFSSKDLIEFLSSFKTISESIELLKKFIRSIETGIEIFSDLELKINERVNSIQNQLADALYTVDEISIRGSEIISLSQILYEIYNIVNAQHYRDKNPYVLKQFKYLIGENLRILKKINIGIRPSLLSSELLEELHYIMNQVTKLYELIINNVGEVENLNSIMNKIAGIKMDINQVFSNRNMIADKISDFKKILKEQLLIIENLIAIGSKIITKLKTLAIFSRLEKSHSMQYHQLITPIIEEFNQLLTRMTSSFNALESGVTALKTLLNKLDTFYLQKDFSHLELPDFSRIKIFYDDTLRVFEKCSIDIKNLRDLADKLDRDNFLLKHHWNVYEEAALGVLNFQPYLQSLLSEKESVPSFIKSQNVFAINLFNDPVTLKPDLKTDATSQQVIVNYSTGLFQFGFGTSIIPGLCDEYSVSEDGKDYIFHLRDDLKYANGKKLNIEDVKAGILKGLNGPNHNLLEMIAGAREYLQSKDENLLWVKVVDQHRVKIRLEYPYLAFLSSFATNIADPYIDLELPVGMG
ncbi:MAG: ABC transporter substrate-binding protein, partial [candidate division WOR-3 bacterium]